jgi:hypothetical protein
MKGFTFEHGQSFHFIPLYPTATQNKSFHRDMSRKKRYPTKLSATIFHGRKKVGKSGGSWWGENRDE